MKSPLLLFILWLSAASFCPAELPESKKGGIPMEHKTMISLTFQKEDAEQAMNFYVDLFDHAEIIGVHRWGPEGPGKEGTIMQAKFELNGVRFLISDSPPIHAWDFTPAVSIFIHCESEEEIKKVFDALSEGGKVAMPLDNYGFSRQFAWVIDRFGVSWQLNLD